VKITAAKADVSTLSDEAKQAVGDRPVYNFSVTSGDKTISQFGGSVTVAVPYTPKPGENPNAIVIYYINAQGKPEIVSNCKYDPATGTVTFNTTHFSQYAVGYNKVSFGDVPENAWYSKAVNFIAARGITSGSGNGQFSPLQKLTRGQFIVMVMKAYGISPDQNPAQNFADAGNSYYTNYLAAAKRLGIAGGVGDNRFAPDKEITRQEMFVLLYNALKATGNIPEINGTKTLADFTDGGQVASWAKDAMTFFVQTGKINGAGGKLSPTGTTSRAEMAQVLYNLLSK
ncbi:MAG: S-layer homology domain-containing protein, partial [Bacillota bacterium]|nr:S-layer homology domain-containing protein [Bacillota bacterium]